TDDDVEGTDFEDTNELFLDDPQLRPSDKPQPFKSINLVSTAMPRSSSSRKAFKENVQTKCDKIV
ncbi:hypothetical protein Tco_1027766, partial [Tanacetum coccineum]